MKRQLSLWAVLRAVTGLLLLLSGIQSASADAPAIYNFAGPDGNTPEAALVQGRDGNFYGTTTYGGAGGYGTVFKLTTNGTPAGTTLITLLSFNGVNGANPAAPLLRGKDGNFYGTTMNGNSGGTVFKLTTDGTAAGTTLITLVTFYSAYGEPPQVTLILGSDGNFYGTTSNGGSSNDGTVFKITTNGTLTGTTLTTLVNFNGVNGIFPGALVEGSDGDFYGTTQEGGSSGNDGTVFKMTTDGTLVGTALTTLINFNKKNGAIPQGALIQGNDGNFYGTTYLGGSGGRGTVFKLTTDGTAAGTIHTTLVNFHGSNGSYPGTALVQGDDGNFYGTTVVGSSGDGTVFKMTTDGTPTGTTLATLVNFQGYNGNFGGFPDATLIQGSNGKFYGTTYEGGSRNAGTVFAIDPRAIQSVTFTPMTLAGGTSAMGEVALSHVADSDMLVTLTSSNSAVLPIRASVTITAGHRHALFTITAKPVTQMTDVTITATLNAVSKYSAVRVTP